MHLAGRKRQYRKARLGWRCRRWFGDGSSSVCAEDGRTLKSQKTPTIAVSPSSYVLRRSELTSVPHFLSSSSNRSCENDCCSCAWWEWERTTAGSARKARLDHNMLDVMYDGQIGRIEVRRCSTCRAPLYGTELCNGVTGASYRWLKSFRDRRCGAPQIGRSMLKHSSKSSSGGRVEMMSASGLERSV